MKEITKTPPKIRLEKIERITLPKSFHRFCLQCETERIFVSTEQAGFYFGLTAREIFRLAEANTIHFHETKNGVMFVCVHSIANLQSNNFQHIYLEEKK